MPYASTPLQQTWPSLAARKRRGAEKREREAARMRAEADDLDRRWREYIAKREARASTTGRAS